MLLHENDHKHDESQDADSEHSTENYTMANAYEVPLQDMSYDDDDVF